MTKDILITKQQLEIEVWNEKDRENRKIIKQIKNKFIGIGKPLNDNSLKMNNEQLKWCASVFNLVEKL